MFASGEARGCRAWQLQSATLGYTSPTVRQCVPHCERSNTIHNSLAAPWIASSLCAHNDADGRGIWLLHAQSRRTKTDATLSANRERIHATRRRTAVELATCPRQCAVALQSNFCRHTHRMVNLQVNVLTSAQTSLAGRLFEGAFAPASTTIRHHAGAIGSLSSPQGVIRMFNFRGQNMKRLLLACVALSVATAA